MNKEHVKELVEENGELHLVVEEHEHVVNDEDEDYVAIRQHNNYSFEDSCIAVDDGANKHHIPYDRIVYIEVPGGFPD